MTWIAPDVVRVFGPQIADERATLADYLDAHRQTLLFKCAGLTGEQLARRSVPPATLSLLGLVRHMTEVERVWFRHRIGGVQTTPHYWSDASPDADFDDLDPDRAEADFALFHEECAASRAVYATASLDQIVVHPRHGEMSVRNIVVHMIEEYARHNGHADLLRQCVDGATGE